MGPEGGSASRGDMSLFVPPGAVDTSVELLARLYTNPCKFPLVDVTKDEFIFSPVLSLEPHGYQFKQPVLVRCPFSAVPGGWQLVLLRETQTPKHWEAIVTYNTDTDEVTTNDCDFDVDRAFLSVTHFCNHCWCGRRSAKSIFKKRRKQMFCSVFGFQHHPRPHRWILEVILYDRCSNIFDV